MKLTVGSGDHYAPGWVNIDVADQRPLDVRGDMLALPFRAATFEQIYLGHVLEHIPWKQIPGALHELRRVARGDARIMVVGPCLDLAVRSGQPRWLLDAIVAHGDGPGGHAWTPTAHLTRLALEAGGLPRVAPVPVAEVVPPAWPNPSRAEWQCAFAASAW
jgi:hypothetical protein